MGGRWDAWAPNAFLEQSGPAEPADILTAFYCPIQVSAGFYPGQFLPHDQTDRLQHANAGFAPPSSPIPVIGRQPQAGGPSLDRPVAGGLEGQIEVQRVPKASLRSHRGT